MAPRPLPPLRRAKVWLLGDKDYPEAVITLPEQVLRDLPDLFSRAQQLNPAVPLDSVIQTIWRLGCRRLNQNLVRRIPVKGPSLPGPSTGARDPMPPSRRRRPVERHRVAR